MTHLLAAIDWDWVPWAKAAAYLVATLAAARTLDWLLSRRGRGLTRVLGRPLSSAESSRLRVARRLLVAVVLFVGIGLALVQIPQVGSLAQGMLASAGITALVVGLASRSIIANFVSGLIIAFSQPIRIGDRVTVDDVTGSVEEIRLTYTYIRTADNRRVLIPNEQLTSRVIHNYSLVDGVSAASLEFEVPPSAPLARVSGAVLAELSRLDEAGDQRSPSIEVVAVTVGAVRLRVTVWADSRELAEARIGALHHTLAERLQREGFIGAGQAPSNDQDAGPQGRS